MHQVIKNVIERDKQIRVIELYGPFNDSQKMWVSETRKIYHANVYRLPILALLHNKWIAARNRGQLGQGRFGPEPTNETTT